MKTQMKAQIQSACGVLALGLSFGVGAAEPGLTSSATPDLSGIWFHGVRAERGDVYPDPLPLLLPDKLAKAKAHQDADAAGAPHMGNSQKCLPQSLLETVLEVYPVQILQRPDMIVFLQEDDHRFRVVYLNEKPPAQLKPTWYGHAYGRWEGDTLVIDSTGASEREGTFHRGAVYYSDQVHTTERLRLVEDGKRIELTVTVQDPKTFTSPWTFKRMLGKSTFGPIMEYVCAENNRDVEPASEKTTP